MAGRRVVCDTDGSAGDGRPTDPAKSVSIGGDNDRHKDTLKEIRWPQKLVNMLSRWMPIFVVVLIASWMIYQRVESHRVPENPPLDEVNDSAATKGDKVTKDVTARIGSKDSIIFGMERSIKLMGLIISRFDTTEHFLNSIEPVDSVVPIMERMERIYDSAEPLMERVEHVMDRIDRLDSADPIMELIGTLIVAVEAIGGNVSRISHRMRHIVYRIRRMEDRIIPADSVEGLIGRIEIVITLIEHLADDIERVVNSIEHAIDGTVPEHRNEADSPGNMDAGDDAYGDVDTDSTGGAYGEQDARCVTDQLQT
ncbi:NADH:ubiquinone oxidoreductase complex I intermediate-associated 30, putative [Babesia ovata]|uniref:NADH:ubiquinone oxidoreductase complex I intermediate-associated 30, putative n=1 Tax=Babesia ovata TaxID=189622 RepID=A0A2H6KGB5_9APIC|nr:NADH:ubiquinone oxidoreductase complex I intermediate-associated 30, putative [Babesia ovata]GBE62024.1 NADH:ubiquinone oxidoreductase complex I intermediate-associated 30, putative [Babesia ovata]